MARGAVLLFAAAGPSYGALLTILAVTTEELGYHRYHSWHDFALLVYGAVAECAGFRQAHACWRLRGLAGAVLRHGAHRAGQPGARAHGEPAFGVPGGERHVRVR